MEELPNIDPEFIVIIASVWCNDSGVGINYSFDGARFNNRNDAIKHGFKLRGSDDFNIGQTYGDDLILFGWMDKRIDEDEDTMREIAESAGLTFDPRWYRLEYSKATGRVIGHRDEVKAFLPAEDGEFNGNIADDFETDRVIPIAATDGRDVDWIDVTGWGVFKGHAIPVDVARYIAEKINLYAQRRAKAEGRADA